MADAQIFNVCSPVFMSCYFAAKKNGEVAQIQILWHTILRAWFPPIAHGGCKIMIKSLTEANNEKPVGIVLEVWLVESSPDGNPEVFLETPILMVACKGCGVNTPSGWEDATQQLIRHLENNSNGSTKMCTAVAMGTEVDIYDWEHSGGESSLQRIHAGRLDVGHAEDRITLETVMEEVKSRMERNLGSAT
ncbi:hypothetical protein FDECE_9329 [Fusarium decemcellulare]|nr:hypothetical protein FDECE_9329 [Fusarium decemcellulare]